MKKFQLGLLWSLFAVMAILISGKLISLQIFNHDFFYAQAMAQQAFRDQLSAHRGEILSKDKYPLATNKKYASAYAVPREIKNIKETAQKISDLLSLDYELVYARLNKPNDPYEPLKDKVPDEIVKNLLNIPGIKVNYSGSRIYPEKNMAAQLLGYVDKQGRGKYGLEGFYDKKLRGTVGLIRGRQDAVGSWVGSGDFQPAQDGEDLILTIDHAIQFQAEKELAELMEKYQAKGGSILILEPNTGAIRAMASAPSFDPNYYYQEKDISVFLNPVINSVFEPGSVAKLLTISAAIDDGAIDQTTTYIDQGVRVISGYDVHNFDKKAYGKQSITDVLMKSLNLGAIFAVEQISKKTFKNYLEDFGLGQKTKIKLYGELRGDISNLKDDIDINYATAAFGQGISVTPLQLAMAIAAIANDGYLLEPRIFENDGIRVVRQVISSNTARVMKNIMRQAADNYSGVKIKGYNLSAKTGTAQIPEFGVYAENKWIHSFIGFGPTEDPKFLVLLKLDQPIGARYAITSLAPAFHNLARFLLQYYKVAPRGVEPLFPA